MTTAAADSLVTGNRAEIEARITQDLAFQVKRVEEFVRLEQTYNKASIAGQVAMLYIHGSDEPAQLGRRCLCGPNALSKALAARIDTRNA